MANNREKKQSAADFWDIASLVPPKRGAYRKPRRASVTATEITLPDQAPSAPTSREAPATEMPPTRVVGASAVMVGDVPLPKRYVSPVYEKEAQAVRVPEAIYRPDGVLLREVRIFPHKNEYVYYAEFSRRARQLLPLEGEECAAVSFFSYMPQYSQLSEAQLAYYLWWRTSFRRGEAIDADYSYLLLYLYEIINLGDAIDPKTGQENMLRLWLSYRARYPRLDAVLREWLCDYSLLYRLPPPKLPEAMLRALLTDCTLKEFYVSAVSGEEMCDAVLYFCSNYDYKKSKFYQGDAILHFDRLMRGAVREALALFEETHGGKDKASAQFSTATRSTFAGAICAYPCKKHIEVDYASFSHTYELRYIITDVLKYTENALRGVLGVKSRLSTYHVSIPMRERLDTYLKGALPQKATRKRVEAPPAYEKRYEPPKSTLSLERAAQIEAASWQTTRRLVEAFSTDSEREKGEVLPQNPAPFDGVFAEKAQKDSGDTLLAALGEYAQFVLLADSRDRAGQRAFAMKMGSMPDAIADKINTVTGDMIGDIILEDVGGVYAVVEDYRELLREEGVLK